MEHGSLLRHHEPGFAHAEYGGVSIGGWSMAPTLAHLEVLAETQRRIVRDRPTGLGVVNVIVGIPAPSLDGRVREQSEAMIRTFGPSIVAIATVVEAQGFFASAVRGLLLSQRIVARSRYADSVFDHVESVPPWMTKYAPGIATSEQRSALLDALRAVRDILAK